MPLPGLVGGGYPYNDGRNFTYWVYGSNASNAVSYSIGTVAATVNVTAAKFNELATNVNNERIRRGHAYTTLSRSSPINSTDYNTMVSALNVAGPGADQAYNSSGSLGVWTYPQIGAPALPGGVSAGVTITATHINDLINSLYNAGIQCTCNCNYCTCNCNYCTCNCNYACTCNCNYSDERLKENIEFVGVEQGLNMYSWNYIWDKTKTYVGVIAQEILHTPYASAISIDKRGFYMVDYSQLPVTMRG
jgi:hypothetical protein